MTNRLFKLFDNEAIEHEIEEEFRFHLEQLTHEHLLKDMSLPEAKGAALNRFGNVEQFKDQCVEISKRRRPLIRLVKALLIIMFSAGVLIRVLNTEMHVSRVGDILIFIALLGRLFLYVRGMNPSSFRSSSEASSLLMLNGETQRPIHSGAQDNLTPIERLIADK